MYLAESAFQQTQQIQINNYLNFISILSQSYYNLRVNRQK